MHSLRRVIVASLLVSAPMAITPLQPALSSPAGPVAESTLPKGAPTPAKIAEGQLKQMGESIHRVKRAAADLVRECQQQNELIGGEIDFIGTDIIPIMPATAEGFGPPSYLPPRKKYLDLHLQELTMLMPILQEDIDTIPIPDDDVKAKTTAAVADMKNYMQDLRKHYTALQTLIAAQAPYDNQSIVNEATGLHGSVSEIDRLRKEIYNSIKRDPDQGKGTSTSTPPAKK